MDTALFHQLHLSLLFEIDSFEKRVNQLIAGDYPTGSAVSFMDQLLKYLKDQRERISQIINDLPIDPKGAFDRLRSEHRKLIYRSPFLVHLENAQTLRVPWSLVPSIEAFARVLLPNWILITSAGEEFNYSIDWRNKPWAFLFVPSSHRIDAFLHVLVGHELFHPLLESFLNREQANVVARLRQACENYLSGQPSLGPLFEKRRLDQMVEHVRYIWYRALEELICDCGGAAIFGPAAVLGSVGFFLSDNFDDSPEYPYYYPPFRYRLRTMLKYPFRSDWGGTGLNALLATLSSTPDTSPYVKSFKDYWQIIENEAAKATDVAVLISDIYTKIAYAEVDAVLDSAWEYVKGLLSCTGLAWLQNLDSPVPISWIICYEEVANNVRNLRMLVPCGEVKSVATDVGVPSTVPGISLAAWINHIHQYQDVISDSPQEAADQYARACRLFLKSLEDSELKREFIRLSTN